MGIEHTKEYQQSIKMLPACNRVICEVFDVNTEAIERFDKGGELFILDQQFHIDLKVTLPNHSTITGQEKALSNEFYKYRTFTIEFYQNRYTKEPGEFFKIASQFYLHGYSDMSGVDFAEWKIIDILLLLDWMKTWPIHKIEEKLRPAGGSRASFLPIPYKVIPKQFILAESHI